MILATVVADHAHHTHGDSLMYDTTTFVNDVRVFRHLESLRATYKVYLYLTASDTSEVFHRVSNQWQHCINICQSKIRKSDISFRSFF